MIVDQEESLRTKGEYPREEFGCVRVHMGACSLLDDAECPELATPVIRDETEPLARSHAPPFRYPRQRLAREIREGRGSGHGLWDSREAIVAVPPCELKSGEKPRGPRRAGGTGRPRRTGSPERRGR